MSHTCLCLPSRSWYYYYYYHLQQSRISKFSGGGPPDPLFKGRGGEEREGRRGRGRGKGRERIGKGGSAVLSNGPGGPGPRAPKPQGAPQTADSLIFSSREISVTNCVLFTG